MNSVQKRMLLRLLINLSIRALIIIPSGYAGYLVARHWHGSGGLWQAVGYGLCYVILGVAMFIASIVAEIACAELFDRR
jgi:hypothetical protein